MGGSNRHYPISCPSNHRPSLHRRVTPAGRLLRSDPYLGVQLLALSDVLLLLPELLLAALPLHRQLLALLEAALLLGGRQLPLASLVLLPQLADRLLSGRQTGTRRRLYGEEGQGSQIRHSPQTYRLESDRGRDGRTMDGP